MQKETPYLMFMNRWPTAYVIAKFKLNNNKIPLYTNQKGQNQE